MGSNLAMMLIGVTDIVMVGWHSVEELAALILATTLFFNIFILGSGGATPFGSSFPRETPPCGPFGFALDVLVVDLGVVAPDETLDLLPSFNLMRFFGAGAVSADASAPAPTPTGGVLP